MLQSRFIFSLLFHQLSLHTDSDTYHLFSNKSISKIQEDSIVSKRKKKIWIRFIGIELVGAQSWAYNQAFLADPTIPFGPIWDLGYTVQRYSVLSKIKNYQNPSSIDADNACPCRNAEIIKKIHGIVLGDPKVKKREIAEASGISIMSMVKDGKKIWAWER